MKLTISRRGVLALLAASPSCRRNREGPRDASALARSEADRRLRGSWVLLDFQPEVAPEPMLGALLSAQLGRMTVSFDGATMHAAGTGVETTRRYQVTEAYMNRLSVRTFDEVGVTYDAVGEFRDAELWFESRSSPWRGRGRLRRG